MLVLRNVRIQQGLCYYSRRKEFSEVKAIYMDGKQEARIGDVVSANGMRGIVISVDGTFLNVLGIGTSKETGDT
jgi:hypothetical protein